MESGNISKEMLSLSHMYLSNLLCYKNTEEFFDHCFFYKIDLTDNKLLDHHIGFLDSSPISTASLFNNSTINYEDFIKNQINKYVSPSDRQSVAEFLDCNLIKEAIMTSGSTYNSLEFHLSLNNKIFWFNLTYNAFKDENNHFILWLILFDINTFKLRQFEATKKAQTDVLTGLKNRAATEEITEYFVNRPDTPTAFITFDIDNFKQVNDKYGHLTGDKLLIECSKKLVKYFTPDSNPDNSIICRLGGDEFLVLLKNKTEQETDAIIKKFITDPLCIQEGEDKIASTISVGYSMYPEDGEDYKKLYKRADVALYSIKMNGKCGYKKFEFDMLKEDREKLSFNIAEIFNGMPEGFFIYRADESRSILFANEEIIHMFECKTFSQFMEHTQGTFKGFVYEEDYQCVEDAIEAQLNNYKDDRDYITYRIKTVNGNIKQVEDFGRKIYSENHGELFYVTVQEMSKRHALVGRD